MNEQPEMNPEPITSSDLKVIAQELLKNGFIASDQHPERFATAARLHAEIGAVFEPLDLTLKLDEMRGLAVVVVAENPNPEEAWSHPLVRRQRLTLEQSLLVALLRQAYVLHEQETGLGVSEVKIPQEDILVQLETYLGDSGSDQRNATRLANLLEQLKPHGIVAPPDKNGDVTVRPLITHLADPASLTALLAHFRSLAEPS